MVRYQLHEAAAPHRRITVFESNVDPHDAEACVALLRTTAKQLRRKPAEVVLRFTGGKRPLEYRG
jgi:hypothetical protein